MNALNKLIVSTLILSALSAGTPATASADDDIWFTHPEDEEIFYLESGQTSLRVFVRIAFLVGPYGSVTKIKLDDGAWIQDITAFTTDPLEAGTHHLAAELWEYDELGELFHVGSDNISFTIAHEFTITAKNEFPGGKLTIDSVIYVDVDEEGITNDWPEDSWHELLAHDAQEIGGYLRTFDRWTWDNGSGSPGNPEYSFYVSGDETYEATFLKNFDISIATASYIESGGGGAYNVNGTNVGASWDGSVLEQESITLEGVPPSGWILSGWSDGNTTNPRVITPTDHTTLSAIYKKHLGSGTTAVLESNSQRKIMRDLNDNYHLAYESGGGIWYTRSTDGGSSWTNEAGILPANGYSMRSPSLTVQKDPHIVVLVYEAFSASDHFVMARTINPATGAILSDETVYYGAGTPHLTNPVLASGEGPESGESPTENYTIALWIHGTSGKMFGSVRPASHTSGSPWPTGTELTTSVVSGISVAPISESPADLFHVVWIQNKDLHYSSIDVDTDPSLNSTTTVIASGNSDVENLNPSAVNLSSAFGHPGVAWEEWSWEIGRRVIKYKESSNWSQTKVWSMSPSTQFHTPSLTGNVNSGDLSIIWRAGSVGLKYVQRTGGQWSSSISNLASGLDPMASVGWNYSTAERVLGRNNSSPYLIINNVVTYEGQEGITGSPFRGRGGRIIFSEGEMRLVLLSAELNNKVIAFPEFPDTLGLYSLDELGNLLRTESIVGYGNLALEFLYSASGSLPAGSNFIASVRDVATDESLLELGEFAGLQDTVVSMVRHLSFPSRPDPFRLVIIPIVDEFASLEVEEWYVQEDEETAMMSRDSDENSITVEEKIPAEFKLYDNYPNPFNPTTTIRYELPENSHVSLEVYNMLGETVALLVDETRKAGYHSVAFDGQGLASGLYLYRLQAGDFVETKKLVLLK